MKKRLWMTFLVLLTLGSLAGHTALKNETIVVAQPSSPVLITSYSANFFSIDRRIHHELCFRNTSSSAVAAIGFGFVSFDYFDEFIGARAGYERIFLPASQSEDKCATFEQEGRRASIFLTGVAFVSKVRFDDGRIWSADLDEVMGAVTNFQGEIELQELEMSEEK